MPRYFVYEVQRELRWRKWAYEITADTPEEAREYAASADPEDHDYLGDSEFLSSGWAVRSERDAEAWQEAARDCDRQPTDCPTCEAIAKTMDGREWGSDTCDMIARHLRAGGRLVGDLDELAGCLRLPAYGCVVWLGDPGETGCNGDGPPIFCAEARDFARNGKADACEVSAPDSQDFLDAINSHFGTAYAWEDFPGR